MAVRIFKDPMFARWAKKECLEDADIAAASVEIENGLADARLGGFLIKKRIAAGKGKSGGFRTILAHRQGKRLVCLFGFRKNERDNITDKEQDALRKLADWYMSRSDADIENMLRDGIIKEIKS